MLNVWMVENLEFWYTIFEVRGQNMCSTPGFHADGGEPVLLLFFPINMSLCLFFFQGIYEYSLPTFRLTLPNLRG